MASLFWATHPFGFESGVKVKMAPKLESGWIPPAVAQLCSKHVRAAAGREEWLGVVDRVEHALSKRCPGGLECRVSYALSIDKTEFKLLKCFIRMSTVVGKEKKRKKRFARIDGTAPLNSDTSQHIKTQSYC